MAKTRWEYKTLVIADHIMKNNEAVFPEETLNEMGLEGWELVSVINKGRFVETEFGSVPVESLDLSQFPIEEKKFLTGYMKHFSKKKFRNKMSCLMTYAQIENLRVEKVMDSDLD